MQTRQSAFGAVSFVWLVLVLPLSLWVATATAQVQVSLPVTAEVISETGGDGSLSIASGWSTLFVYEGSSDSVDVFLTGEPSGPVTVTATLSGDSDLSIDGDAEFVFDAPNWWEPKSVLVHAAEDPDTENGSAVLTLSAVGLPDATVEVFEQENDEPLAISAYPSELNIYGSVTDQIFFNLNAEPPGPVTVTATLTGDQSLSLQGNTEFVFDASNWWDSMTLSVAAARDSLNPTGIGTVRLTAPGLPAQEVVINRIEPHGQEVLTQAPSFSIQENGARYIQIALSAEPATPVTVSAEIISGDSDLVIEGSTEFVITSGNWTLNFEECNSCPAVKITGRLDADTTNGTATLRLRAPGLPDTDVLLVEADLGVQPLVVPDKLEILEGTTAELAITLSAPPLSPQTLTVERSGGDPDIIVVDGGPFVFDATNWNVPQLATLQAADDSDSFSNSASLSISTDGESWEYVVRERDDEYYWLDVPSESIVREGEVTEFQLRLSSIPSEDVTVTATLSSAYLFAIEGPNQFIFTPENWNQPQQLRINAYEDANSSGGDFDFLWLNSASRPGLMVRLVQEDNDVTVIVPERDLVEIPEGSTAQVMVRLDWPPTYGITLYSALSAGDASLSISEGNVISFNLGETDESRPIVLTATEDENGVDEHGTLRIIGESGYGVTPVEIRIVVLDNDAVGTESESWMIY